MNPTQCAVCSRATEYDVDGPYDLGDRPTMSPVAPTIECATCWNYICEACIAEEDRARCVLCVSCHACGNACAGQGKVEGLHFYRVAYGTLIRAKQGDRVERLCAGCHVERTMLAMRPIEHAA
jgi:hypothetical protein